MRYLVTGAGGFIGKRLVRKLLGRPGTAVYALMREPDAERVAALRAFWGATEHQVVIIPGDLRQPGLGLLPGDLAQLDGAIDHVFHLGAIYSLEADSEAQMATNVAGTRHVVDLAKAIGSRHFHHVSSIAAAGLYPGTFREDMHAEAGNLAHPYFATKHMSEQVVREHCGVPWRIYRPGIVVGDSKTGEMDKIDGPYYAFKLIQKLRGWLPSWFPVVGIEGGFINLVPVDFVVDALDHIAHLDGHDGACFHLTDAQPRRLGEVLSILARAAHAPPIGLRIDTGLLSLLPQTFAKGLAEAAPMLRVRKALLNELGLPESILALLDYPTRFDNREAERLLSPAGIAVPPLESYAWRLWDYWERHLDPDLRTDRSLAGRVAGRVVLITGGSAGIGKAVALRLARAGATTIVIARDAERLAATRAEAARQGLRLETHAVDITDPAQCTGLAELIARDYGGIDILVNNAGRSIRRGIEQSLDRLHDYERTMKVNYFGTIQMTMAVLPQMLERGGGHVVNVSSIGVLTSVPRFSAYVASKAAMEAWMRCAAAELLERGIAFTTINMPLVRTEMIAPTQIYEKMPTLSPDEAADLVEDAIIRRPERIATRLGLFGQLAYTLAPRAACLINNSIFGLFPDSAPAAEKTEPRAPTPEQMALINLLKGLHY